MTLLKLVFKSLNIFLRNIKKNFTFIIIKKIFYLLLPEFNLKKIKLFFNLIIARFLFQPFNQLLNHLKLKFLTFNNYKNLKYYSNYYYNYFFN